MFIKETIVKRPNGRIVKYLYLVESQWVKDKKRPTHKLIYSFGRLTELNREKLEALANSLLAYLNKDQAQIDADSELVWTKTYGTPHLIMEAIKELKIDRMLRRQIGKRKLESRVDFAVMGMILNRCMNPLSKIQVDDWLKNDIHFSHASTLKPHHFYRGLDFLESGKDEIEDDLYWQTRDLFNRKVDMVFYDTTTTYVEGEGGADCFEFGYSRDQRPDKKQIVVGLATDRDGLPLASSFFPGSTMDVKTVKVMSERVKRFQVGRVVFVCDRGMVSEDNLLHLEQEGYDYLVGIKLRQIKEVRQEVLSKPGRFQKVADNLEVKEVYLSGKRYIICHNREEAVRDKSIRESVVKELEEELERVNRGTLSICGLFNNALKKRFTRELKSGRYTVDRGKVREDERFDGKYVLLTTERSLTAGELAVEYKNLYRVERAFRSLKQNIDIRPIYHWKEYRVKAHLTLCVLSYFVQRYIELKMGESWATIQRHFNRVLATKILYKSGSVIRRNQLTNYQKSLLYRAKVTEPPLILGK